MSPVQGPSSGARLIIWFLTVLLFSFFWLDASKRQHQADLSYTAFKDRVRAEQVASVTLQGEQVSGTFRKPEPGSQATGNQEVKQFITTLPPIDDPGLMPLLEQYDVEVRVLSEGGSWWQRLLIGLVPWLLIIGLFWYVSSRMQERMMGGGGAGGIFGFAKSRAKRFDKGQSSVTFDDVAGLDNAKRDLREISDYLRDPQPYRKLGAKIPRGVLLMGPPGTGKTLLARAVAGEANVPFFSISASEFIEMFVGVGASRVRDMFQSAKKESPSIIFIDEIDSIGRARGTGLGGGHDEREQTLNQILNEMDGFEPHEAVVVLAATNRPDVLDAALMRPGRFDRKVTLDLPDRTARQAILKIHSRAVPLAGDVDLVRLAALTVGFSGADLENLINEAALLAGRKGSSEVGMALMLEARDKVVLGGLREMLLSDDEKQLVAFHEAGHAVVASLLPHADPLDKVTIIPRGRALGVTEQIPETEQHNFKQSYLHDRIGVMLGGRCSEKLIFGEVSSGAEEDLKQATLLARHMVTHWGMSEKIGPVAFHRGEEHIFLGREMAQQRDFSEHTAEVIDDELSQLLKHREVEISQLLNSNRVLLESVAKALLEKETLEADEIRALIDACPKTARGAAK
ncbi:ATP-dependent zinc metalloprotease FtsH [Marinobacterium sedimentorum]|uniref:ATP-dependent zinc metalloprotease FtsH n=1 Tax=Marinobacterium sedimentorum TaxID=2927804 RepID=UPI0020C6BD40|nr:ATP-dependent zinc metalloprotease FtsH [Marinobacterium sedimentorum]MCP8688193.1 ATP-dependent zinc metalloprotease FtsH [Marinobacterium sedimentorum]